MHILLGIAIIKLIFDRVESLKPWGYLLGDSIPNMIKVKRRRKKRSIK